MVDIWAKKNHQYEFQSGVRSHQHTFACPAKAGLLIRDRKGMAAARVGASRDVPKIQFNGDEDRELQDRSSINGIETTLIL